jgi:hypothetical protein
MSHASSAWHPTTFKRFIKAFPTSACTVLVETDDGKGYLKALGGPEGPHTLACEWVGTRLAKWFGLPTFDFGILPVTDVDDIPFHNGTRAQVGPAFVTRAESGESWGGKEQQLQRLINPQDIGRLVVFDTWTLNCDRHSIPASSRMGRARVNRNNVFLSEEAPDGQFLLKAMDHTHCFTCGKPLSRKVREIDNVKDSRVFGLFPEFRPLLDRGLVKVAVRDLQRMDRSTAVSMTQSIPGEWDVTADAVEALVDLIVGRAAFVANTIESQLWPQLELDFDSEGKTG